MERSFDQILFTAVFTVVIGLGFFVVNPGGYSRELLERAGLWRTFYENYLPELPAESEIAGQDLGEIPLEFGIGIAIPGTTDRWDRLIGGLENENRELLERIGVYEIAGPLRSGDARALDRRIKDNEKKIAEYRILQAKEKASGSSR